MSILIYRLTIISIKGVEYPLLLPTLNSYFPKLLLDEGVKLRSWLRALILFMSLGDKLKSNTFAFSLMWDGVFDFGRTPEIAIVMVMVYSLEVDHSLSYKL